MPREIVGDHVQGHLGGNLRQALHQKVRRTHPHLEHTEGMLDCLAAHAHRLRVLIETLLHRFDHALVFPSRDSEVAAFDGSWQCQALAIGAAMQWSVVNLGATKWEFGRATAALPGKRSWTSDSKIPIRLRALRKIAEETKNHDLERDLYIEERKAERGVNIGIRGRESNSPRDMGVQPGASDQSAPYVSWARR
jgi:hypothetical protein